MDDRLIIDAKIDEEFKEHLRQTNKTCFWCGAPHSEGSCWFPDESKPEGFIENAKLRLVKGGKY